MSTITLAGLGGLGYWMWTLILPGEERRKELLKVMRTTRFCRFPHLVWLKSKVFSDAAKASCILCICEDVFEEE